jgi:hypothetical protein
VYPEVRSSHKEFFDKLAADVNIPIGDLGAVSSSVIKEKGGEHILAFYKSKVTNYTINNLI